jgi:hypothetical protein
MSVFKNTLIMLSSPWLDLASVEVFRWNNFHQQLHKHGDII